MTVPWADQGWFAKLKAEHCPSVLVQEWGEDDARKQSPVASNLAKKGACRWSSCRPGGVGRSVWWGGQEKEEKEGEDRSGPEREGRAQGRWRRRGVSRAACVALASM
ncbi:unnamed protein product [Symbiodinium sp. CCMP2592]|nr:unnamed protein product [Symbiodinium sp. CCMP2592]